MCVATVLRILSLLFHFGSCPFLTFVASHFAVRFLYQSGSSFSFACTVASIFRLVSSDSHFPPFAA